MKLRLYYEARLSDLRRRNDGDLDLAATARLRGQIAECRHLLALHEAPGTQASGPGPSL